MKLARAPYARQWMAGAVLWTVGGGALAALGAEPAANLDNVPLQAACDVAHVGETPEGIPVWLLRGRCKIVQAETALTADHMVVWQRSDPDEPAHLRWQVFLEGSARIVGASEAGPAPELFYELTTRRGAEWNPRRQLKVEHIEADNLYVRGAAHRQKRRAQKNVRPTQYVVPGADDIGPELLPSQIQPQTEGVRRVRIFQRSAIAYNVFSFQSHDTTPPEQVWILSGGIQMLIDGMEGLGTVDLSADRMVIWTQSTGEDFTSETFQSSDAPMQVYLEGNIVGRQGFSTIRANRAFYDAREDRAILLDAELRAEIPNMPNAIRVRAEKMRQISKTSFRAENAWVSTSQFGKPGYRVQASDVVYEERMSRVFKGKAPAIDPETGLPEPDTIPWMTTNNAQLLLNDTPIFYAPRLSGPAEDPNIPLRTVTAGQDRILGTQVYTTWNLFKLFGQESPEDLRLDLLGNYFSDRGPAIGTAALYKGNELLGLEGKHTGSALGMYIHDSGNDNLGLDRRSLVPPNQNRGRAQWRHWQEIGPDLLFQAEIGYISDRNYLEQYYETEFDTGKDNETMLYLKKQQGNWAATGFGRVRPNDFDTTTEWLPKADVYGLAEPLFDGLLSWSSHSSAGLAHLKPAAAPTDPNDLFTPLPFVSDSQGAVLMTRHELSAPLSVGPAIVTPYALGEAAYWSEDMTGNSLARLYGSAGVRGSLMFTKIFPNVNNSILGLNGLAHKMVFDFDYSISGSTADLSDIPQYNEFDEQAQYRFRDRLVVNTFGGTLPPQFDPRFYGVRTGAAHNVTAPYHELVDDQQVLRLGWRHRLQTKTGPLANRRIKDWMTLDLEASFFPNSDRDDFGELFGLLGARYTWNVGDRTTILANGFYDTFDNSQQLWNVGVLSQRSERGSVYVGVRQVKGAGLDSQIVTASYSYKMSPKWIASVGTAYDLAEHRNRGQSLTLTRVGADFVLHLGANYDQSKDNVGVMLSLEPRFLPFLSSGTQLGSLIDPGGGL